SNSIRRRRQPDVSLGVSTQRPRRLVAPHGRGSPQPQADMQLLDTVKHDIVYAIRALRREPGLAAGLALTLALALGANAAMAGLVGRLLLAAPPGVNDAARVARISLAYTGSDGDRFESTTTSYPAYQALGALNGFQGVAAVSAESLTIGRGAELGEVT